MSDPPPGPRPPTRNRDVDWDTWPVQAYLAENYRELHPCDAAVIRHHSGFYRQFFARVHAVNVTGPLLGIQHLAPLMPPGSSVVNVGSSAALTGHYPVAYTASKWALRGCRRPPPRNSGAGASA